MSRQEEGRYFVPLTLAQRNALAEQAGQMRLESRRIYAERLEALVGAYDEAEAKTIQGAGVSAAPAG